MDMNRFNRNVVSLLSLAILVTSIVISPVHAKNEDTVSEVVSGLELRGIGPAMMGGRIADIAVDPKDKNTWFIAVGSGGVWKTSNAGITFSPLFDKQISYSIGTVAIDPSNSNVIWVGTGENVSGRHVAWGDGVYKSMDGGQSWKNVGLKNSQHISKFLIDPKDSNVVYVAAEGPLWSVGGDRGVYKTTDGGANWTQVLTLDENTGVTDLEFMPGNTQQIYAAAYQRRRSTWALLAGGPSSGIYKSHDSGASWSLKSKGLPEGDMGKIGLAVTKANPDIVYATIEANKEQRGFYRSLDQGESWSKQNPYISGGTGPHYYQEIEASQSDEHLVYQMDVFLHRSRNGGEDFDIVGTGREKHSDNHAMWIDPDNGKHYLVGTDAGLYETFDEGKTYRHFSNMPISQFYKLALDTAKPYYNILGGAQDLGTLYGPSRTTNTEGVRKSDWYVPLGADGYGVGFHPKDNNTFYMMWQGGSLMRHDKVLEEGLRLTPQPAANDAPERWNWDSPFLNSPHQADRIYYGSQRVWQSDDRGNSWQAISSDLTRNQNRYELKMTDERVWGIDSLYDTYAMSLYNTTTALSESPVREGILYAGTDDGLIQTSLDGGQNWRKSSKIGKVPNSAFINDVEASLFDAGTVFAVASNHKTGDFSPYVVQSSNNGKSWQSIAGDLPSGVILWAIEQDHVNKDLLFLGAENGLYFTLNRGKNWNKFSGAPTIAFRDIKVHRRDNDLVGATFGRGFYIMDDYTSLRAIADGALKSDAALFPVRDAWWYVPNAPGQAKGQPTFGSSGYVAANPEHGASFTYYLQEGFQTLAEKRREGEKKVREKGKDVPFPGYALLKSERLEEEPAVMILIRDSDNQAVRWIEADADKGLHRVSWDMRKPAPHPISLEKPKFQPPWAGNPEGPLAAPGLYSAELMLVKDGGLTSLAAPQSFKLKPLPSDRKIDYIAVVAFQDKTSDLLREIYRAKAKVEQAKKRISLMEVALISAPLADNALFAVMKRIKGAFDDISISLNGDVDRDKRNTATLPSLGQRVSYVAGGHWQSTTMPTQTMVDNIRIAEQEFATVNGRLTTLIEQDMKALDDALTAAGAPSS
jgi:photosystem II stability/assembly factor-like uncharacterized protein